MELFRIGQKLSIFFEKDGKIVEISCILQKFFDDRLVIELPPYFMRYINFLEVGNRLTVKVFSKIGTLDFNTVIISSPLEDEFAVELDYNAIKLTEGGDIPVISAVETMILKNGEEQYTVKTFEISTEFIKFYSNKKFSVGDNIDCELVLPNTYGIIKFKGDITEVDTVYDNEYTLTFYNMNEDDRQTLLYYMYVYENTSGQE